jgi:TRAP transporter TAXI family solute receptor
MHRIMNALLCAASVLLFASGAIAGEAVNLSIATGGTGGVYYPLGGGLGNILAKAVPGMSATAEVTGGSVDNMRLIGTGKPYIAFTQADAAVDALRGEDKFKGKPIPVRAMIVVYPNRMHVVTVEGTGVNRIEDLKGKRVSTGAPGSATEVFAFRVIEAAGLHYDKDMKRERLGVSESVNAIKDKKIDAFFWVGGLPTAGVTDLAATPGVKIKLIDIAHLVPIMAKKHGNIYVADVIPKGTYPGQTTDNKQASVQNLIVANENMNEQTVYNITKAVFEHQKELIATHQEAANIKLDNQKEANSPLPWHPGALRYYKERGVKMK